MQGGKPLDGVPRSVEARVPAVEEVIALNPLYPRFIDAPPEAQRGEVTWPRDTGVGGRAGTGALRPAAT